MIYVTVRQKPKSEQITWLDLMMNEELPKHYGMGGSAGTITRTMAAPNKELLSTINVNKMIQTLKAFNERHKDLYEADKKTLYRHFSIPKKAGGLRPIDAPCDKLQDALRELKNILENQFGLLYHTAAFAYIKNRCITNALYRHQNNESNWFLKTDFSGFFPSTTLDFTMKMLSMLFPLSEVCRIPEGKEELKKALSLGFLNDGLPQGTVLSPSLTNMIMIPIDHRLFNELAHHKYVYTRYADDIHISAVEKFDPDKMVELIKSVLKEFDAPFEIKKEKTHYGSRKGKNFLLGLILNKENDISIGWRRKRYWKAMTANLIMDYKNHKQINVEEVRKYEGLTSYYMMIEPEYFKKLTRHFNNKFHVNLKMIVKNCNSY